MISPLVRFAAWLVGVSRMATYRKAVYLPLVHIGRGREAAGCSFDVSPTKTTGYKWDGMGFSGLTVDSSGRGCATLFSLEGSAASCLPHQPGPSQVLNGHTHGLEQDALTARRCGPAGEHFANLGLHR